MSVDIIIIINLLLLTYPILEENKMSIRASKQGLLERRNNLGETPELQKSSRISKKKNQEGKISKK